MVIAGTQAALSSDYHGLLAEKQKGSRFGYKEHLNVLQNLLKSGIA